MATRTRRTPEQLAKYYQEKADNAKAKAEALAKQKELNELIELGKLAKAGQLGGGNRPLEILGKAVVERTLAGCISSGGEFHLAGLRKLFAGVMEPSEWAEFADWWKAQGYREE